MEVSKLNKVYEKLLIYLKKDIENKKIIDPEEIEQIEIELNKLVINKIIEV